MSFPVPPQPQPPGAMTHLPMNSPLVEDKFIVPQSGIDRDALKRRKASKSKTTPTDLRRSASTPHLAKAQLPEHENTSPTSDKKRNKLGYHRSSIACSHCRRRKIRCQLPIPEDVQGRCTNCIRLKKECNFYPVDQAPLPENKPTQQARRDTAMSGAPSASSQSSPRMSGASQPGSVAGEQAAHMQLQSPQADVSRQQRETGYPVPANVEGTVQASSYAFNAASGGSWTEQDPSYHQYSIQHRASIADPQAWSANSTPTTAQYSHDGSVSFPATTPTNFSTPQFAYSQSGNQQFVPPARSMSYSHIEGLPQQLNYQNVQYGHQEPHPAYTLPSQPQLGHSSFAQHVPSSMSPQHIAGDSTARNWSSGPSPTGPMPANHQYQPNVPPSYYAQQSPVNVYDPRAQANYAHHNYYNPGSRPG